MGYRKSKGIYLSFGHIHRFWQDLNFWVVLIIALIYISALGLEAIPGPSAPSKEIEDITGSTLMPTYSTSAPARVNEIAVDCLSDSNKRIILMYPWVDECGIGIVENENDIFATCLIRKNQVSIGDRRYLRGIMYYYRYYPTGQDANSIDYSKFSLNDNSEAELLNAINSARDEMQYGRISANKELSQKARDHSASMALQNKMFTLTVDSPYYMVIWHKSKLIGQ
jgi:hypothetical protein